MLGNKLKFNCETQHQHNTTRKTHMKEALALIYAALIAPLVEAINANTAAIGASKSSCTGTPSPAANEAPEPQPEAPKRGRKPAADKTPPAGEAPAGEEVTAEDIIAHAKSLDNDAKENLKGWMQKTYGVQSVAELKESDRPAVLKMLKDKGATDTRAPAPASDAW